MATLFRKPSRLTVDAIIVAVVGLNVMLAAFIWSRMEIGIQHYPLSLDSSISQELFQHPETLTAKNLNTLQPSYETLGHHVNYVGEYRGSNGVWTVSVRSGNSHFWSAVARGTNGHCYAIALIKTSTYSGSYSGMGYQDLGVVPTCSASLATPQSAYLGSEPS